MKPKIRHFTLPELAAGYLGDLGDDYVELLHFANFEDPLQADDARLEECRFSSVALESLMNARVMQCELEQVGAPVLQAAGAYLNDVRLHHSRFGSADFAEAQWDSVIVENCKFGWLNFRGAQVRDVIFRNCQFEEVDLGGQLQRVSFEDCRAGQLTCSGARLSEVDLTGLEISLVQGFDFLRGATISSWQVGMLAEQMASHLGLRVKDI